jgi:catechol 2,3-dioxygenase-like lactoylglutathione lyase family enzyme
MIDINEVVAWSALATAEHVELNGPVNVAVRDLSCSVRFYARVFGFHTCKRWGDCVATLEATKARATLMLHEQRSPLLRASRLWRRWGFVVTDLDRARQLVWELGVKIARDSGEPDHIYRWSNGRSLYIKDPNENEIELVETPNFRRACMMSRWDSFAWGEPGRS